MNRDLEGLTALITGSSHGIGRVIAEKMLQEGCTVILTGREACTLADTVEHLQSAYGSKVVYSYSCDFCAESSLTGLAEWLDKSGLRLDILVCNVGSGRSVPPLNEDPAEWRRMLDINLTAATSAIHYLMPFIRKSRAGSIVLIASICGVEALGAPVAYSVAKSGVIALGANLARPLAKLGLRINVVSPGNIMFPGSVWEEKLKASPGDVQDMLDREVPMGRLGTAEDVAEAVAFLASPRAGFITGANLIVDGGQTRSI